LICPNLSEKGLCFGGFMH